MTRSKKANSRKARKKKKNSQNLQKSSTFEFGGVQAIQVGSIAGLLMIPQRSVAGGPCY